MCGLSGGWGGPDPHSQVPQCIMGRSHGTPPSERVGQTDRQTLLITLPSHTLRMRAVISQIRSTSTIINQFCGDLLSIGWLNWPLKIPCYPYGAPIDLWPRSKIVSQSAFIGSSSIHCDSLCANCRFLKTGLVDYIGVLQTPIKYYLGSTTSFPLQVLLLNG